MSRVEQCIMSILKYTRDSEPHSALSTVYMLAVEVLDEYQKEQRGLNGNSKDNKNPR